MKIKKGDKVIVIAGSDKGKTGVVQRAYPKLEKVVVEGINVHKKHKKPTQASPEGSIKDIYVPIHVSNVAIIDPKTKKATRVKIEEVKAKNGKVKKVRVTVASKSKLD